VKLAYIQSIIALFVAVVVNTISSTDCLA